MHLIHYLDQKNHTINAVIVVLVIHGLWGEVKEFQSREERWIVSLQMENEPIKKQGHQTLLERMKM